MIIWRRVTVGKLWTDGHQVALDRQEKSPCRFDGNVMACVVKLLTDGDHLGVKHRLTPSDHHVVTVELVHLPNDLAYSKILAGWIPRGIGSITVPAAEVTTRGPQKRTLGTGQQPLSL
jgi:hypothetical protein